MKITRSERDRDLTNRQIDDMRDGLLAMRLKNPAILWGIAINFPREKSGRSKTVDGMGRFNGSVLSSSGPMLGD